MRNPKHRVRIVGGQWRGRRLDFPDVPGLRPTPDRVRETLFNWLAPVIPGSRCLDLFAGSGALGLEAASRGAAAVTLVDTNTAVIRALNRHCAMLGASRVEVRHQDAWQFLAKTAATYDVIFLDPPFAQDALPSCLKAIEEGRRLQTGGYLYIETKASVTAQELESGLPAGCRLLRRKRAGQVAYCLAHAEKDT